MARSGPLSVPGGIASTPSPARRATTHAGTQEPRARANSLAHVSASPIHIDVGLTRPRIDDYGEVKMVPFAPTITSCVPHQTTPESSFGEPDACFVHVIPSDEVTMLPGLPELPTATNCVLDQATPNRLFVVPGVRTVHVTPSGDSRNMPCAPRPPASRQARARGHRQSALSLAGHPDTIGVARKTRDNSVSP